MPPPPDVEKLANLARLDVSPEEVKEWTPKISAIVDWCAPAGGSPPLIARPPRTPAPRPCPASSFQPRSRRPNAARLAWLTFSPVCRPLRFGKLREVDLEGVPPALRAGEEAGADPLRPDAAVAFEDRRALLRGEAACECARDDDERRRTEGSLKGACARGRPSAGRR